MREALFRQTFFGWFLDQEDWTENCILIHFMLGRQVLTDEENENIPLCYHVVDNFHIQFGKRRVFSSSLESRPIRGKHVEELIKSEVLNKLDDNDAVSLCCVGILQLVLLGLKDRRPVPNWILRLANDRDGWDKYPWGSHVRPTLYQQLKDANVRCWPALYATQATNKVDKKSYSITGFAWAFKLGDIMGLIRILGTLFCRAMHCPVFSYLSFKMKRPFQVFGPSCPKPRTEPIDPRKDRAYPSGHR
nr:hypothetical protein [Tanacetum cinerariifolium]